MPVVVLLTAIWLALLPFATAAQEPDQPLLMPGKKSLSQRVLAKPGAVLHSAADAAAVGDAVTPFTAYYVYARRGDGPAQWLQIGVDRHGGRIGWLRASDTIEWNQGLTVAFRDPIGRDRALLFRDRETLRDLARTRDLKHYNALYEAAEHNALPPDSPVVAIQPQAHIDINKDFYLVPIRQHEDIFVGNELARLLQVSSVPLQASGSAPANQTLEAAPLAIARQTGATGAAEGHAEPAVEDPESNAALPATDRFSAGLVFAIDATLSMDPYIDRTREAVMKIYDRLGDAGLLGNVNFGLVAYRDNLAGAPDLGYLARTFVSLEEGRNPGTFIKKVNDLSAATTSSQDFVEDAYAGVKQAIESMNWKDHYARYVVLITDAGAREADDPLSSSGLSSESLKQLARDNNIAIFVLHLLTPATMANHASAAAQYQALSQYPGIGSLYYGVPTGDVEEFGVVLDALAGQITDQVQLAVNFVSPAAPTAAGPETPDAPAPAQTTAAADTPPPAGPDPIIERVARPEANPQLAELQSKVAKLGYALRMQYLRRDAQETIPNVFDAWVLDRDIRNPAHRTLDVRILLTRDQLSDMHDILRQVLQTAEEGLLSPQSFLDELKSLAATLARDPEQLGSTTAVTAGAGNSLADLGFMAEYIDGLPYTGEVMNLSLEDWQSWPAKEQIAFLQRLEEKISYYRALHDHTDLWVSLDGGPVDGDSVFPVALEQLP